MSVGVIGIWGLIGVCESLWVFMGGSIDIHGCLRVGECWHIYRCRDDYGCLLVYGWLWKFIRVLGVCGSL